MSFTSKNLQSTQRSGISVLKGATLFFLGMSVVMFMTQAFQIVPSVRNAKQYIQEIIFTADGYSDSLETVTIDGDGGNAYFAGIVTGAVFCLEDDSCIDTRLTGGTVIGGDSVWSTGVSDVVYYNDGNVGIGTTSPSETFQIGGGIDSIKMGVNGTQETGGNFLRITSTEVATIEEEYIIHRPNIQLNAIYTNPSSFANRKIENQSSLLFQFATGSYDYDTKLSLSTAGLMTLDGNIRLETGGYIRSAANANQLYLGYNGRVGIGTNSLTDTNKLHISTNIPEIIKMTNTNSTTPRGFAISSLGRFSIYEFDGGSNPERLSIASGGNVGIGKNPSYKLDVAGTGNFDDGLLVDGRVGIGTDSPSRKLTVNAGTVNAIANFTNDSGGVNIEINGGSTQGLIRNMALGKHLEFSTHTTIGGVNEDQLFLHSSGNVGIGTNSPGAKLHVKGPGTGLIAKFSDAVSWNVLEIYNGSDEILIRNMGSNKNMEFGTHSGITYNQDQLRLLANGNVGIKSNTPQATLSVSGSIQMSNPYDGAITHGSKCTSLLEGTMIYKRVPLSIGTGTVFVCTYIPTPSPDYLRYALAFE